MFDIGMTEMLVVGVVALIVVGPKDLPGMFRTLGQFTGKAKRMAREFSSAMEAAADDAGVSDVSKTLKAATNPKKMGLDAVKKAVDPSKFTPGSETEKLAKDRAETAKKIHEATAKKEAAKRAAEAEAAAAEAKPKAKAKTKQKAEAKAKPKTKTAKKTAAKKPAAKKASS
jgi:sec-independent protein translocase protein TatB